MTRMGRAAGDGPGTSASARHPGQVHIRRSQLNSNSVNLIEAWS
jgi:hypothetical protein